MKELTQQHRDARGRQVASIPHVFANLDLDTILPMTPAQLAARVIEERWGAEPLTARLVDLNYDFYGYPAEGNVHLGKVRTAQSLVQSLMSNYQTVGAGRFGETAFGLYTPPAVGPTVRIVEIDESINPGGGFRDYEGIYRQTVPQVYGPSTQLALQPAEFKQWVWTLEFKEQYGAYVHDTWPEDEQILGAAAYPLRTSVRVAFVMAAHLQHQENSLTGDGLGLALRAAGLSEQQVWKSLTLAQMQKQAVIPASVEAARLVVYRYTSTDIWCFRDKTTGRVVLYIPGNSSPFQEFVDHQALAEWVAETGRDADRKQALAEHFSDEDRQDGTFHAGVLTALEGMATYPRQFRLKKGHGFFNNDGYWPPAEYVGVNVPASATDPFAQWVLVMKQAAHASIDTIRDDAQVNRADLSAVVEPVVQWINKFGPLALFVPGGEGLLALAGLIDAGYGLAQAVDSKTLDERSAGVARTVFGLLNALPVAIAGKAIKAEERVTQTATHMPDPEPTVIDVSLPVEGTPVVSGAIVERVRLLRGIGAEAEGFSDEVLGQIGRVIDVDNDLLALMQAGRRPPTPILADTLSRFRIDQDLRHIADSAVARAEQFTQRYQALQHSGHEWVKLFQQHYPGLPKNAIEQILDRSGVAIDAPHTLADAKRVLSQLSVKAEQYERHVRLTRAYEGLYLPSVANLDSDVLALHSLQRLPGWSSEIRIEVVDGSRVIDSIGRPGTRAYRQLIRCGSRYRAPPASAAETVSFAPALLNALAQEQRSVLGLRAGHELEDLQASIREAALPRTELELGLRRMDSGMAFESSGLRGGGFPPTAQAEALSNDIMKLQVKEFYPAMTEDELETLIHGWGEGAQRQLVSLTQQLTQLRIDLVTWIEKVEADVDDMQIEFLDPADEEAQGLSPAEIEEENDSRLFNVMEYERQSRIELAKELEVLWQLRGDTASRVYVDGECVGFRLELDFEQLHCLPELNVKLPDVALLSVADFTLTQGESLSGFLECLPNLQTLNLEGTDLRIQGLDGQWTGSLPAAIGKLSRLTTLNLKNTLLTLTEQTAGQLGELTRLQVLDLSNNPLGVPPLVLKLTQLQHLNLRSTGITRCPIGILDHPYLQSLDLRNNGIARVPEAVRIQSVGKNNVLLSGNPLTDEDSLRWVSRHRQQTGINVWIGSPMDNAAQPGAWLEGVPAQQAALRAGRWQRVLNLTGSGRFFGALEIIGRTADFRVDYTALQQRVWHMVDELEASPGLCRYLFEEVQWPAIDGDDPFAGFVGLEGAIAEHGSAAAGQRLP